MSRRRRIYHNGAAHATHARYGMKVREYGRRHGEERERNVHHGGIDEKRSQRLLVRELWRGASSFLPLFFSSFLSSLLSSSSSSSFLLLIRRRTRQHAVRVALRRGGMSVAKRPARRCHTRRQRPAERGAASQHGEGRRHAVVRKDVSARRHGRGMRRKCRAVREDETTRTMSRRKGAQKRYRCVVRVTFAQRRLQRDTAEIRDYGGIRGRQRQR